MEANSGASPACWKKSAKLMDLLCLLQLVYYIPHGQRTNLHDDVISHIKNTLLTWSTL